MKTILARNLRQAPWRIWAISFPLIALIALIVSTASYNSTLLKPTENHYHFLPILGNVLISFFYVAFLAPYVLAFARLASDCPVAADLKQQREPERYQYQ